MDKLLKQKLAVSKLLPDRIAIEVRPDETVFWWKTGKLILDTEWLQIVQWVEEGLTRDQIIDYETFLHQEWLKLNYKFSWFEFLVALTFQQRLSALEAAGIIKV